MHTSKEYGSGGYYGIRFPLSLLAWIIPAMTSLIGQKGIPLTIKTDSEHRETRALLDVVNFRGRHVLEIGCGDGRLTWLYADQPARITAIDPNAEQIAFAKDNLPNHLRSRIEFRAVPFEDFAAESAPSIFDIAILSYSLC